MRRASSRPSRTLSGRCVSFGVLYLSLIICTVILVIPIANDQILKVKWNDELQLRQRTSTGIREARRMLGTAFESGKKAINGTGVKLQWLQPGVSEEEALWLEPLHSPPDTWPDRIIITIAVKMEFKKLQVLIRSFERNVKEAMLVILADKVPWGWSNENKKVVLQIYHPPTEGPAVGLGYWAQRFLAFEMFLKVIAHHGHVILTDARDVAFLGDPFTTLADDYLHIFQESTKFPSDGETTEDKAPDNWQWLARCYGAPTAWSHGGTNVISAGFLAGPTDKILIVLSQMREEMGKVPRKCLQAFGGDQAILIHIVRSGKVTSVITDYRLHSNERGPVLTIFKRKAPYVIGGDKVFTTMGEVPFAVIHGYDRWPDLNDLVSSNYLRRLL